MNAYYVRQADQIFPIYGANSLEEAKQFVAPEDQRHIVETSEPVYMHINTGSVDFAGNWEDFEAEVEAGCLVEVTYSAEKERWIEAE